MREKLEKQLIKEKEIKVESRKEKVEKELKDKNKKFNKQPSY